MEQSITFKYKGQRLSEDCMLQYEFEDDKEISILDLHSMCKRFCLALGFQQETVDRAFGADQYEEDFFKY